MKDDSVKKLGHMGHICDSCYISANSYLKLFKIVPLESALNFLQNEI